MSYSPEDKGRNPKNKSVGAGSCIGSTSAKSRSHEELNKLYFRSTQSDFANWLKTPEKDDSYSEIYRIGHKTTKNLPFQYKNAPSHGMDAFSYTNDFRDKSKEVSAEANRELAVCFSRPHNGWVGSPSGAGGMYNLDFVKHPRRGEKYVKRKIKPELLPTQILSPSDVHHERDSSGHQFYSDPPPRDMQPSVLPIPNLFVTGLDPGDCYKSTYGEDISRPASQASNARPSAPKRSQPQLASSSQSRPDLLKVPKKSRAAPELSPLKGGSRTSTAPAGMTRKDKQREEAAERPEREERPETILRREAETTCAARPEVATLRPNSSSCVVRPGKSLEIQRIEAAVYTPLRPNSSSCVLRNQVARNIYTKPGG